MRKDEQIVIEIRKFLDSAEQTDSQRNKDLAEMYATMCSDANSRMERCLDLINSGKKLDAINIAENNPPLLDTCSRLLFNGRDEWKEFCGLYNWMAAPDISEDALKLLSVAYKEGEALQPLIAEFRKGVHKGTLDDRISILRRIKSLDQANPDWSHDLERLEKERLAELATVARQAIESRSFPELQAVYATLKKSDWSVKPEERIVTKIDSELKGYRAECARNRAKRLLDNVAKAYSRQDDSQLESAFHKWDEHCDCPDFQPTEDDLEKVAGPRKWLEIKTETKTRESTFNSLLAEFKGLLEGGAPNKPGTKEHLDTLYAKLKGFDGFAIPASTEDLYKQEREDIEVGEKRSFASKLAVIVVASIALTAGIAWGINEYSWRQLLNGKIATIRSLVSAGELDKALEYFEKLEDKFKKASEVAVVGKEVSLKIEDRNSLKGRFDSLAKGLEAAMVSIAGLSPVETLSRLPVIEKQLAEADSIAETTNAQKARLSAIKASLMEKRALAQLAIDNEFTATFSAVQEINNKLMKEGDPRMHPSAFAKALTGLEAACNKAKAIQNVSKELVDNHFKILDSILAERRKELEAGEAEFKARTALLDGLYAKTTSLNDYLIAINDFSVKFPDDHNVPAFKKVADNMQKYLTVTQLENLNPALMNETQRGELKLLAAQKKPSDGNLWCHCLNDDFFEYDRRVTSALDSYRKELTNYLTQSEMTLKSLRFVKSASERIVFYCAEPIPQRYMKSGKITTAKGVSEIRSFQADVRTCQGKKDKYYFEEQLDKTWKVSVVPTKDKPETLFFGLKLSESEPACEPTHTTFTKELLGALSKIRPADAEGALAAKMDELRNNKELNPVFALILFKGLHAVMKEVAFGFMAREDLAKESEAVDAFYKGLNCYETWPMPSPETSKQIKEFFGKKHPYQSIAAKDILNRNVIWSALSRRIASVGVVRVFEDALCPNLARKNDITELWALLPDEKGGQSFYVVGSVKAGKPEILPEFAARMFEGMPVFAPTDGKNTTELAASFKDVLKKRGLSGHVNWPMCWPANVR